MTMTKARDKLSLSWAKAHAMMVYAQEHNKKWVYNGFLQVIVAVHHAG